LANFNQKSLAVAVLAQAKADFITDITIIWLLLYILYGRQGLIFFSVKNGSFWKRVKYFLWNCCAKTYYLVKKSGRRRYWL